MMNHKKLLIIPGWKIWPINSGGAIAQLCFLNDLTEAYEVHLLLSIENLEYNELPDFQLEFPKLVIHYDTYALAQNNKKKWINSIKKKYSILTNRAPDYSSALSGNYYSKQFSDVFTKIYAPVFEKVKLLRGLLDKQKFEIIQIEMIHNIGLIDYLPDNQQALFVHHELFANRIEEEMSFIKDVTEAHKKTLKTLSQTIENHYLGKYSRIAVFTEPDQRALLNQLNLKVEVTPFSLIESQSQTNYNSEKKPELLFLGGANHLPNKHGMEWLLTHVLPRLSNIVNYKLKITGEWPLSFRKEFSANNVQFTGNVSENDVGEMIKSAIVIVPIFIGSGLKVKVMKALQAGCPVISTSSGLRGITGIQDQSNVLIANTPEVFANSIISLLSDQEKRKKISIKAKDVYIDNFEYEKTFKKRLMVYQQLLK